jgi:hypothetical protein
MNSPIVNQYSKLQENNVQLFIKSIAIVFENNLSTDENGLSVDNKHMLFYQTMFSNFEKINETHFLFINMLNNEQINEQINKNIEQINSMFPKILQDLKGKLHTFLEIPCNLIDKYIQNILYNFTKTIDVVRIINEENDNVLTEISHEQQLQKHEEQQQNINRDTLAEELMGIISDDEDNDSEIARTLFVDEEEQLKKIQQIQCQIKEDEIFARNIHISDNETNNNTSQEDDSYKIVKALRAVKGWWYNVE